MKSSGIFGFGLFLFFPCFSLYLALCLSLLFLTLAAPFVPGENGNWECPFNDGHFHGGVKCDFVCECDLRVTRGGKCVCGKEERYEEYKNRCAGECVNAASRGAARRGVARTWRHAARRGVAWRDMVWCGVARRDNNYESIRGMITDLPFICLFCRIPIVSLPLSLLFSLFLSLPFSFFLSRTLFLSLFLSLSRSLSFSLVSLYLLSTRTHSLFALAVHVHACIHTSSILS